MKFKKLRYNLILIGLIAVIFCYVGISFFLIAPNSTINQGEADGGGDLVPDLPEDPNDETENPDDIPEDGNIPSGGLDLVRYAINILNTGKGYTSNFASSMMNTTNVAGSEINVTQRIIGSVNRGVNSKGQPVSIEENYYYSNPSENGSFDSQTAKFFKGFYTNAATDLVQIGLTNNYNKDNKTFDLSSAFVNKTVPTKDALNEYCVLQGLGFPLDINEQNFYIMKEDSRSSATTTYITVGLKNGAASRLDPKYSNYYAATGQMKNISVSSIKLTFSISKSTGFIKQIEKNEVIKATSNISGLPSMPLTSTIKCTQKFAKMNREVVLRDSL